MKNGQDFPGFVTRASRTQSEIHTTRTAGLIGSRGNSNRRGLLKFTINSLQLWVTHQEPNNGLTMCSFSLGSLKFTINSL